jgi:S1-C subfamily serine protease
MLSKQLGVVYRGGAAQQGTTRNAICKIHYFGQEFDYYQPYNTHTNTITSTGTGFVLDAFPREDDALYIVTAHHVVEGATKLLVEFSQLSLHAEPAPARVVAYDRSKDVALLALAIPKEHADRITALRAGDSDAVYPTQPVTAAGFALANDYQVTKGTISGRTVSRIQVDCAVNPGNSGGPLLDDEGHVLGVVVSKLVGDALQNVNFVTPIVEALHSLRRYLDGDAEPLALPQLSFNASFVPSSQHLDAPAGAYVTQVHADSSLAALGLARKDVLCELDGRPLDYFGKVHVEWWPVDPLEADTLLERAAEGDTMRARYWSHAAGEMREGEFVVERARNTYRDHDPEAEALRYSCRGSLVVQPLLPNHASLAMSYRSMLSQPQVRERSFLVITAIRPECPFVAMDTISYGDIVTYVNGAAVRTIDDYVREWSEWEASDAPTMTLQLLDGNVAVAPRAAVAAAEERARAKTGLARLDVV